MRLRPASGRLHIGSTTYTHHNLVLCANGVRAMMPLQDLRLDKEMDKFGTLACTPRHDDLLHMGMLICLDLEKILCSP